MRTLRIAVFSVLFVLSALITLAVLRSGADGAAVEAAPETGPVSGQAPGSTIEEIIDDFSNTGGQARRAAGLDAGSGDALSVQDFILPQSVPEDTGEPYLLRPRLERWGEQQVGRYWIPLETIALDLVERENDRRIEELFEDIP
ncbi:MAG: hypothetical protein JXB06_06230 [Spirochaetales bacterium]|nr:hypothetical protein [Spirochaetales bacterium]